MKFKVTDLLAKMWEVPYRVPPLFGGGAQWPLEPEEAKLLAIATEDCLAALPAKQREQTLRALNRLMPWFSLVATVGIITYPRLRTDQLATRGDGDGPGRGRAAPGTARAPGPPGGGDGAVPDGNPFAGLSWEHYARDERRSGA